MLKTFLTTLIHGYRFALSPWIGNACRYWPTCSEYSIEAIDRHGALRGCWMTIARLARCHPYGAGGVDPVPLHFSWRCACRTNAASASLPLTSSPSADEH